MLQPEHFPSQQWSRANTEINAGYPWAAREIVAIFAFSRFPARTHFPADVFRGAALATRALDMMCSATEVTSSHPHFANSL